MKFKLETEFQETEIGRIPKEWRIEELGRIVKYVKGKKPSVLFDEKSSEEYIPYLTAEYMRGLDKPKWCNLKLENNVVEVSRDDVIMIWDGSYAGHVFTGFNGVLTSTMVKITPIIELDKKFLYYYLLANYEKFRSTTVGTGIPHVNKKVFEEFLIPVPPIHEQKSIAEILSTADWIIDLYYREIERLDRLKKALMGKLLTGRIRVREENGKTVFYRETEFQDTEIGKIPKEWRIVKLNRIAQIIMGQSPPSETYNKDGIGMPFLQGKMEFGRIYPSPVMYTSDPIKIAEANDVLISVRAPVGDVNIAPYKICIGRGLAAIRFDPNQANYMFFFYYFQSIKERLETLGKGSTFKAITKKDLEELTVLNPSLKEQKLIGEILSTVDRTIELYYEERTRLDRLKRGLMDLLLTGRVRVMEE